MEGGREGEEEAREEGVSMPPIDRVGFPTEGEEEEEEMEDESEDERLADMDGDEIGEGKDGEEEKGCSTASFMIDEVPKANPFWFSAIDLRRKMSF